MSVANHEVKYYYFIFHLEKNYGGCRKHVMRK